MKIVYRNPKIKSSPERRNSPEDLMQAFMRFIRREPEHKNLTPKGYALLMKARKEKP
jgi:hypothetical protein